MLFVWIYISEVKWFVCFYLKYVRVMWITEVLNAWRSVRVSEKCSPYDEDGERDKYWNLYYVRCADKRVCGWIWDSDMSRMCVDYKKTGSLDYCDKRFTCVLNAQTYPHKVCCCSCSHTRWYIQSHVCKALGCCMYGIYAWCDDDDVDYMISFSRFICLFDVFLLLSFT